MIFVTVGTHQQPFTRLIGALASLNADELIVQYGTAEPPGAARIAVAYLPYEDMLQHLEAASVVITHAGVGSILCCRNAGHVPIVVPRLKAYGEHVDDHQLELTSELAAMGTVRVVYDVEDLPAAVASNPPRAASRPAVVSGPLHAAVRSAVHAPAPKRFPPSLHRASGGRGTAGAPR